MRSFLLACCAIVLIGIAASMATDRVDTSSEAAGTGAAVRVE